MMWERLILAALSAPGLPILQGEVQGQAGSTVFGSNTAIDTGTVPETVWSDSGLYPWQAATPFSLEILSSSANDTSAGTGARTVTVVGLDANWAVQTQVVSMNGTSVVALTGTWLRVNSCVVTTTGSGGTNAGNITLRLASAGAKQALIATGAGAAAMAIYTVPAGQTAYLRSWRATGSSVATVGIFARDNTGTAGFQLRDQVITPGQSSYGIPLVFTQKTDIDVRATAVASNGSTVAATLDLIITTP